MAPGLCQRSTPLNQVDSQPVRYVPGSLMQILYGGLGAGHESINQVEHVDMRGKDRVTELGLAVRGSTKVQLQARARSSFSME